MVNDEVEALVVERVVRLERENRIMKSLGCVVFLVAGTVALMGQASAPSKVIESEHFILKDSNGRTRASLHMFNGDPILDFFNERRGIEASFGPTRVMDCCRRASVESPYLGPSVVVPAKKDD